MATDRKYNVTLVHAPLHVKAPIAITSEITKDDRKWNETYRSGIILIHDKMCFWIPFECDNGSDGTTLYGDKKLVPGNDVWVCNANIQGGKITTVSDTVSHEICIQREADRDPESANVYLVGNNITVSGTPGYDYISFRYTQKVTTNDTIVINVGQVMRTVGTNLYVRSRPVYVSVTQSDDDYNRYVGAPVAINVSSPHKKKRTHAYTHILTSSK